MGCCFGVVDGVSFPAAEHVYSIVDVYLLRGGVGVLVNYYQIASIESGGSSGGCSVG